MDSGAAPEIAFVLTRKQLELVGRQQPRWSRMRRRRAQTLVLSALVLVPALVPLALGRPVAALSWLALAAVYIGTLWRRSAGQRGYPPAWHNRIRARVDPDALRLDDDCSRSRLAWTEIEYALTPSFLLFLYRHDRMWCAVPREAFDDPEDCQRFIDAVEAALADPAPFEPPLPLPQRGPREGAWTGPFVAWGLGAVCLLGAGSESLGLALLFNCLAAAFTFLGTALLPKPQVLRPASFADPEDAPLTWIADLRSRYLLAVGCLAMALALFAGSARAPTLLGEVLALLAAMFCAFGLLSACFEARDPPRPVAMDHDARGLRRVDASSERWIAWAGLTPPEQRRDTLVVRRRLDQAIFVDVPDTAFGTPAQRTACFAALSRQADAAAQAPDSAVGSGALSQSPAD